MSLPNEEQLIKQIKYLEALILVQQKHIAGLLNQLCKESAEAMVARDELQGLTATLQEKQ